MCAVEATGAHTDLFVINYGSDGDAGSARLGSLRAMKERQWRATCNDSTFDRARPCLTASETAQLESARRLAAAIEQQAQQMEGRDVC